MNEAKVIECIAGLLAADHLDSVETPSAKSLLGDVQETLYSQLSALCEALSNSNPPPKERVQPLIGRLLFGTSQNSKSSQYAYDPTSPFLKFEDKSKVDVVLAYVLFGEVLRNRGIPLHSVTRENAELFNRTEGRKGRLTIETTDKEAEARLLSESPGEVRIGHVPKPSRPTSSLWDGADRVLAEVRKRLGESAYDAPEDFLRHDEEFMVFIAKVAETISEKEIQPKDLVRWWMERSKATEWVWVGTRLVRGLRKGEGEKYEWAGLWLLGSGWTQPEIDTRRVALSALTILTQHAFMRAAYRFAWRAGDIKYRQLFELLDAPFKELTTSLYRMERTAQRVRSVLHEPSRGLFGSHNNLRPLFDQGCRIEVSPQFHIIAKHLPTQFTPTEAKAALAWAILTVMGSSHGDLAHRVRSADHLVLDTIFELEPIARREDEVSSGEQPDASTRLMQALAFICTGGADKPKVGDLIKILQKEDRSQEAIRALESIKSALFEPFKLSVDRWPLLGLRMVCRGRMIGNGDPDFDAPNCGQVGTLELPFSPPFTYGAFLSLVESVLSEFRERDPSHFCLVDVKVDVVPRKCTVLSFHLRGSDYYVNKRDGRSIERFQRWIRRALRIPRDWRVDVTSGNFAGPWIEFANNIVGVGARRDWMLQLPEPPNVVERRFSACLFHLKSPPNTDRFVTMHVTGDQTGEHYDSYITLRMGIG